MEGTEPRRGSACCERGAIVGGEPFEREWRGILDDEEGLATEAVRSRESMFILKGFLTGAVGRGVTGETGPV